MSYLGQGPFQEFTNPPTKDSFTGDGSTVAFDLAKAVPSGSQNALEVYVNNVRQEPGTGKAFTLGVDGSGDHKRVTFSTAPASSAAIYVINDKTNSTVTAPAVTDLNGVELILDVDGDTSITADTDDRIDFKLGNVEHISFNNSSGDTVIKPMVDAKDIKFQQYDGRTLLDINDGGYIAIANGATGPGQLRLYEDTDLGTNYTAFQVGTQSGDITYTLPTADATSSGYALTSNASGTLSWSAVSANTPTSADGQALGSASLEWSDLFLADSSTIQFGNDQDTTLTHTDGSGLTLNSTNKLMFNDASQFIQGASATVLDIAATDEIELTATLIDVVGNFTNSGTIVSAGVITAPSLVLGSTAVTTTPAELNLIDGGATVGTGAIADGDGLLINDAGTMRVATVQTLAAYLDDEITAMPNLVTTAATTVGALASGSIAAGFGAIDNGTSGIRTNTFTAETAFVPDSSGGADLGTTSLEFNDLFLNDAGSIQLGDDQDVTITHVADTGILINSTNVIQFNDASQNIGAPSNAILDINATDEIELNATLVDVNANLDVSGTIVGASTLSATTGTFSGILKTDDATEATSTTDGSLQTDGGLSVVKDAVFGDDVKLLSDAAVISFGTNSDVTLTHVHDTGVLLNSTMAIQFNDASQYINAPSNAILDINATDEIELNATLVDINANVEISGTATTTGVHTFTAVPVFPNNTVETADIQDNAVTLAKMAGGTDGNIISYDASGDPVAIATGSDGQVLTSTGAGSPPAFEDASSFDADAAQVFNESGADVDFRVESSGNANMLFVDGGNDNVGIGQNNPNARLKVNQTATDEPGLYVYSNASMTSPLVSILQDGAGSSTDAPALYIRNDGGGNALTIDDGSPGNTMFEIQDATCRSEFTARAWVNFIGTGTIGINDSHAISSIADRGTGNYTVTLAGAMGNINWAPVITHRDTGYTGMVAIDAALTTTVVEMETRAGNGTSPAAADSALVVMAAFGAV